MPVNFMTFDDIWHDYSYPNSPQGWFQAIAKALTLSKVDGLPVYGLSQTYSIALPAGETGFLMEDKAQIVCLPGGRIEWAFSTLSTGLVSCPASSNRRLWQGGTFATTSTSATGDIFVVNGDLVTLDGVSFEGVRSGAAIRIRGNRCSVTNPTIKGATGTSGSLGIVVENGMGTRVQDGSINVALDALQIFPTSGIVDDCQIEGISCTTTGGAVLEIKTNSGDISNVQVRGLTGVSTAPTSAVNIRHTTGSMGLPRINGVAITDATITCSSEAASGITLLSRYGIMGTPDGLISNVAFDNVLVRRIGSTTLGTSPVLSVSASGTSAIKGFTWVGGGIIGVPNTDMTPVSTFTNPLMAISHATDVVISDMQLSGSQSLQQVAVGFGTAGAGACTNVAFSDVALSGIPVVSALTAVAFDDATSCGWVRGSIAGVPSASFTSVSFTLNSHGCYVEDANLTKNAAVTKIALPAGSDTRLFGNNGSRQLSPISLGNPVLTALDVGLSQVTATSSYITVTVSGSVSSPTLKTILGGVAGDLLVLNASVSLTVNELGNIRLNGTSVPLNQPQDTLTLLYDGTNWLAVGFSDNV